MTRKEVYCKDYLLKRMDNYILNYGWENFSARNLASHCKCSTQPLYHHFHNLDEIMVTLYQLEFERINRFFENYEIDIFEKKEHRVEEKIKLLFNYYSKEKVRFKRYILETTPYNAVYFNQLNRKLFCENINDSHNQIARMTFWSVFIGSLVEGKSVITFLNTMNYSE